MFLADCFTYNLFIGNALRFNSFAQLSRLIPKLLSTVPMQLFKQKVVDSKVFALCFRAGGGILTLGTYAYALWFSLISS